jgi:hypothetical protein
MLIVIAVGPVRKTLELYFENDMLEQQVTLAARAPETLAFYRQEAKALQKVIHFNGTERDLKEDLLISVGSAAEQQHVTFINLQEPSVHTENDFRIETYEVILQGDYTDLLKVLLYAEEHLQSGKVVSARFLLVKEKLMMHIYIQTSKGQRDENKTETTP